MDKAICALKFMYSMERFATAIYRAQSGAFRNTTIAEKMAYAVENERQHALDIAGRLIKLNSSPSSFGFLFQMAGTVLGFLSRCSGKVLALKAGVIIETRAVKDYGYFLKTLKLDEPTQLLLQRIIADEEYHIKTWQDSIEIVSKRINEHAKT